MTLCLWLQELKVLWDMLDSSDYNFVLDLGMLANRREFLNLQAWLPVLIAKDPSKVISALTMMLDRRMGGEPSAISLAPVTIKQIATVCPWSTARTVRDLAGVMRSVEEAGAVPARSRRLLACQCSSCPSSSKAQRHNTCRF
jgi:hypothetical protein